MRTFILLATLAGCWGNGQPPPSGDPVRLGTVGFDVPHGWQRSDVRQPGSLISVWTPEAGANKRKESITVIQGTPRGERLDDQGLQKLLAGAQAAHPGSKISRVNPITTELGLTGFSIDVELTPRHTKERYRRAHVVLREQGQLVHVIYTAKDPDPERAALETVLATLHRAEASS